ncbi:RNA-binding protein Raly isoform X2 [Corythoichthys intestinalis]|uniref:RNA-binding protein Raly isoform X2 n=1 Tax=Corythoichthys intestinalis TaxID=161448 RepID=UPI0025A5DB35|nr:RNA-binding protein Raly isoform X2 [Corythoichthys intestinalis]
MNTTSLSLQEQDCYPEEEGRWTGATISEGGPPAERRRIASHPPRLQQTLRRAMSAPVRPSNVTNKRDAKSVNSRVFIGNLNTALATKRDVEAVFGAYGPVLGCSVHKGYAFVQYGRRGHARAAVAGHDGRMLAGQTLDVSMAGNGDKGTNQSAASAWASLQHVDTRHLRQHLFCTLFDFQSRTWQPGAHPASFEWPQGASPIVRRPPHGIICGKGTGKGVQLEVVRSQLTEIKENVDTLLGRLERIVKARTAEERPSSSEDDKSLDNPQHDESHHESQNHTVTEN